MGWQRPEDVRGHLDTHDRGEDGLLVRYLVRAVRIGVVATFVVLAPIGVYPLLGPQVAVTRPGLYVGAVGLGLVGAAVIASLPWRRLLTSRFPFAVLRLWSVGDILLISLLVAASGGVNSPLWSVYALTTLFFAATFPRRSQIVMFAFTVVAYLGAITVADAPPTDRLGVLLLRLGVLGVLALMAGFISTELTRQMATHARRARSSRQVAEAGATIGALEHTAVLDTLVDAVADLGFPMGAVVMLEGNVYKITASYGLPEDFERVRLVLSELQPTTHAWVMGIPDIDDEGVVRALEEVGCDAVIVAPLMVGARRVGLLAVAGDDDPVGVEAIQTLATLASNALQNAELYRLKTDFVANVSHELRTPLTVLVGMGETLARRSRQLSSDQLEDLAGRIEVNARRLEDMISTLLDFSRLQARERHLERTEVDVTAIAIEAVRRTEARLEPRRVLLEVEPGVRALGDELMLGQVLDNLLGNVASHTPPATTARVEVRAVGAEVEVAVSDDGPGIAARELDHITERFYRGGDHLTRDGGGLGLGLALVQELLTLNGSELGIAASERGGTRFSFRLQSLRRAPSPDLDELSTS